MRIAYHVMTSPVGLLFLARTAQGLRHLEFMDRKSIKRMIANHAADYPESTWEPSLLDLKPVVEQLEAVASVQIPRCNCFAVRICETVLRVL